jgi:hypothetical protein
MDPEIDSFRDILPSAGRSSTELIQEGKEQQFYFRHCGVELHEQTKRP